MSQSVDALAERSVRCQPIDFLAQRADTLGILVLPEPQQRRQRIGRGMHCRLNPTRDVRGRRGGLSGIRGRGRQCRGGGFGRGNGQGRRRCRFEENDGRTGFSGFTGFAGFNRIGAHPFAAALARVEAAIEDIKRQINDLRQKS